MSRAVAEVGRPLRRFAKFTPRGRVTEPSVRCDRDRLIVVQCKRYASDHKVGRPALQQIKTVIADAGAFRGYAVTTASFSAEATAYAASAPGMVLVDMDALLAWHRDGLIVG